MAEATLRVVVNDIETLQQLRERLDPVSAALPPNAKISWQTQVHHGGSQRDPAEHAETAAILFTWDM